MSHFVLVVVVAVAVDVAVLSVGEAGEELVDDFVGLFGPCGDLDEVVVVVVDEVEGDCTDSNIFPGDGFDTGPPLKSSSSSIASEWLNKWMVNLSNPKRISLQMGQNSGRLVTLTKLIFRASMLSKLGWQHKGHGSTWEEHIAIKIFTSRLVRTGTPSLTERTSNSLVDT